MYKDFQLVDDRSEHGHIFAMVTNDEGNLIKIFHNTSEEPGLWRHLYNGYPVVDMDEVQCQYLSYKAQELAKSIRLAWPERL